MSLEQFSTFPKKACNSKNFDIRDVIEKKDYKEFNNLNFHEFSDIEEYHNRYESCMGTNMCPWLEIRLCCDSPIWASVDDELDQFSARIKVWNGETDIAQYKLIDSNGLEASEAIRKGIEVLFGDFTEKNHPAYWIPSASNLTIHIDFEV